MNMDEYVARLVVKGIHKMMAKNESFFP